jgi:hypothetical protein
MVFFILILFSFIIFLLLIVVMLSIYHDCSPNVTYLIEFDKNI